MWPGVTILDICDHFWPSVTRCDHIRPLWPPLTNCDQVCLYKTSVTTYDQMWPSVTVLDNCDRLWPSVTRCDLERPLWPPLSKALTKFDQVRLYCWKILSQAALYRWKWKLKKKKCIVCKSLPQNNGQLLLDLRTINICLRILLNNWPLDQWSNGPTKEPTDQWTNEPMD